MALEADWPFVRGQVSDTVTLECCYRKHGSDPIAHTWLVGRPMANHTLLRVNVNDLRFTDTVTGNATNVCHKLLLVTLLLSDAGLYQCFLNNSERRMEVLSHGTFLQVYRG